MRHTLWLVVPLALLVGRAASPLPLQQFPTPAATQVASPAASAPANSKVWVGHYAEYEAFLRTAEIDRTSNPKEGKTGGTRHAYFKPGGLAAEGALRNLGPGRYDGFFESYKSEVAAYKLDRLLQLDMVPPAVERRYNGAMVSLQLWAENTQLLKEVQAQKIVFPSTLEMTRQFSRQKVFDDLVANIDENATNLLFDPSWNIIKIDHSRCFTNVMTQPFEVGLAGGKGVLHIDRPFLDRVKALDRDTLTREIGDVVEGGAIDALLRRRDNLVKAFEKLAKEKGETQVFVP
jgi:hypothetical protein